MTVVLLGFPTDVNSSFLRGAANAPKEIRRALWSEAGNPFTESGLDLRSPEVLEDLGDVALAENSSDVETIESAIGAQLRRARHVVSLGGDHSITYPIVRAYAKGFLELSIVHFDAHPDLYPSFDGNHLSHASPFARILEETPIRCLVQIGIRSTSPAQREMADRYGVLAFSPAELDAASAALPDGPVYVTLDLDGLDPAFAPGVSHREPGGLTVREVLSLVRAIPGRIIGADVVELNPAADVSGVTAGVAAKFVRELIACIAGPRPPASPA